MSIDTEVFYDCRQFKIRYYLCFSSLLVHRRWSWDFYLMWSWEEVLEGFSARAVLSPVLSHVNIVAIGVETVHECELTFMSIID